MRFPVSDFAAQINHSFKFTAKGAVKVEYQIEINLRHASRRVLRLLGIPPALLDAYIEIAGPYLTLWTDGPDRTRSRQLIRPSPDEFD